MTREEFEYGLKSRLEDIRNWYRQYDPDKVNNNEEYLNLCIAHGRLSANNEYFNVLETHPVNMYVTPDGKLHSL